MSQGTTRRKFTKEFKAEAARLSRQPGLTVVKAARDQELDRLRRENEQLRMGREILRKASAFFANQRRGSLSS